MRFLCIPKLKLVVGQFPCGARTTPTLTQSYEKLFQLLHQNKIVTSRCADDAKVFDCFILVVNPRTGDSSKMLKMETN